MSVSEDKTVITCTFGLLPEIAGSIGLTMLSNDPSTGAKIQTSSTIDVDVTMSPKLTNVSPNGGGSAGDTRVTLTAVNFSSNAGDLTVVIKGVPCLIKSASETEIICETDADSHHSKNICKGCRICQLHSGILIDGQVSSLGVIDKVLTLRISST